MPRMLRGGPLRFLSRGPRCLLAQPELAVAGLPSLRSGLEVISEAPRPSFLVVPSARPPAFHSRRHELQAARVAASARLAAVATVAAPARDGPRPAPGQRLLPARPGAGQLLHRREEEQRVQGGGGLSGGPRWERGLGAGGGVAVGGVAFPSRAGRGACRHPALRALWLSLRARSDSSKHFSRTPAACGAPLDRPARRYGLTCCPHGALPAERQLPVTSFHGSLFHCTLLELLVTTSYSL